MTTAPGGGKPTKSQNGVPVVTGIPYVDSYLNIYKPKAYDSVWTAKNSGGSWQNSPNYIQIDPAQGQALGMTPQNGGGYYVPVNAIPWIAQTFQHKIPGMTAAYAGALSGILQTLTSYTGASAEYAQWAKAVTSGNTATMNAAYANISKALNTGSKYWLPTSNTLDKSASIPPASAIPATVPTGTNKPPTDYFLNSQNSLISDFFGNWPGLDSPAVRSELANAINSGTYAKDIERQLYTGSPTSGPLKNTIAAFQNAFPALVQARQQGVSIGVSSPAEYMRMVDSYQSQLKSYGLDGMFKAADYSNWIMNHLTPTDIRDRVQAAHDFYQNADPAVRNLLETKWGLSPGQGIAYILDGKNGYERVKDDLVAQTMLAKGKSAGVTEADAYRLTGLMDQGLVSGSQAQQTIDRAASMQNLGREAFGMQNQRTASAQDIMSATTPAFASDSTAAAQAATQVSLAQEERAQAEKAGGSYAASAKSGIGGAGQVQ